MTIEGEYVPSTSAWVREQVAAYEASGGTEANTLRDTGIPVIVVTMRGRATGSVRKIALMRVEHGGEYALVASMGGAPTNPVWYHNLVAHARCSLNGVPFTAAEVTDPGDYERLFALAVRLYPGYADYRTRAAASGRRIPVLRLTPR